MQLRLLIRDNRTAMRALRDDEQAEIERTRLGPWGCRGASYAGQGQVGKLARVPSHGTGRHGAAHEQVADWQLTGHAS